MTFGFHLCKGNQDSRWLVSGGYGDIAKPVFEGVRAHRLLLEYDDERSGGFEPLALVPEDRVVVLGLVTTKTRAAGGRGRAGGARERGGAVSWTATAWRSARSAASRRQWWATRWAWTTSGESWSCACGWPSGCGAG